MIATDCSVGDIHSIAICVSCFIRPPAKKINTTLKITAIHRGDIIVGISIC